MQLFICIQKDYLKLEELMLAFVEHQLPGATLLEGRGMGQAIGRDLPVFANLMEMFPDVEGDSHLLLFVGDEEQVKLSFELTSKICGQCRGIAFSLPIGDFVSLGPQPS
jgi:hypothetical protein